MIGHLFLTFHRATLGMAICPAIKCSKEIDDGRINHYCVGDLPARHYLPQIIESVRKIWFNYLYKLRVEILTFSIRNL
jgi:hypothetical protein